MNDVDFPEILTQRYEVSKLLGEGGMGNVYLAQDKQLPRLVAIKEVRKEFLDNEEINKRIQRESQLHAKIGSHENIVTLYDVITSEKGVYIVLEYVAGKTLAGIVKDNIESGVRLSESVVVDVILQLLKALKRIHAHEVIHRDLKPDNLLIGRDDNGDWQVKLMDFGIAKASVNDDNVTKLTQVGASGIGTPSYMAPEQIDASTYGEISERTDLYAVGIIFYELMIGVPPFSGTLTEVYSGHLMKDVADVASTEKMTSQWRTIICKVLEKKPVERFSSAAELADAISDNVLSLNSETPTNRTQVITNKDLLKTQVLAADSNKTQVAGSDALADLLVHSSKPVEFNQDDSTSVTDGTVATNSQATQQGNNDVDKRNLVESIALLLSTHRNKAVLGAGVALLLAFLLFSGNGKDKAEESKVVLQTPDSTPLDGGNMKQVNSEGSEPGKGSSQAVNAFNEVRRKTTPSVEKSASDDNKKTNKNAKVQTTSSNKTVKKRVRVEAEKEMVSKPEPKSTRSRFGVKKTESQVIK